MYEVLNLGGEGEVPGALNVNNMVSTRRSEQIVRSHPLVIASVAALPFAGDTFEEVVGNDVPFLHGDFPSALAKEAYRVLRWGGTIRIISRTGGGVVWLPYLEQAHFNRVTLDGGYAVGSK